MYHFNPQLNPGSQYLPGQLTGQQPAGNVNPGMQFQQQGLQQPGQGQAAQFGAHETMQVHEVLSGMIEGINRFNLYRPFIQDSQLSSIMDRHLQFMNQTYDNIISYLQNRGTITTMPYHGTRKPSVSYGLSNPAPMHPNRSPQALNDRDVAMGMLAYHKCSAIISTLAALECADPALRQLMQNSANSCMNEAWECFAYMNEKGMYQVPTMLPNTTYTFINTYQ